MQDGRAKWRRVAKSGVCVKKKGKERTKGKRVQREEEREAQRHRGTEERKDTRTHSFLIGGACSPHISLPSLFTLCLFLSCWCGWVDVDRAQFVGIRQQPKKTKPVCVLCLVTRSANFTPSSIFSYPSTNQPKQNATNRSTRT